MFEMCSDQCLLAAREQRRHLDDARAFKYIDQADDAMRCLSMACATISVVYAHHPQMCLVRCCILNAAIVY